MTRAAKYEGGDYALLLDVVASVEFHITVTEKLLCQRLHCE
jgi:hypothetical protein